MPSNDPTLKQSLQPIEGSPPDLFSPPDGCGYAPRCPHAMKVYQQQPPPETSLSSAETNRPHGSRCWLHEAESPFKPAELHFVKNGSAVEQGAAS
jgi:oligopeptide/dipeptide ABC transporter ATP-binding protein